MSKKKYLLILITFIMFFFGMGTKVGAEDQYETKECVYFHVTNSTNRWTLIIKHKIGQSTVNDFEYFGNSDANPIRFYDGKGGTSYSSFECPQHVIKITGDTDDTFRAFSTLTDIANEMIQADSNYQLLSNSDVKADGSGSYACSYDLIKKGADGNWTTVATNQTLNINYLATTSSDGRFTAKEVNIQLGDSTYAKEIRKMGESGNIKINDMKPDPKLCPEYLVPFYVWGTGERLVDAYDASVSEETMRTDKANTDQTNKDYYKKSQAQKEEDQKAAPESLAKCTYYRDNNYIVLDIIKGNFDTTNAGSYYDTYAYYYEGLNSKTGSKKIATVDQSAIDVIMKAKEENASNFCKDFPYIWVDSGAELAGDRMTFEFASEISDPKKEFKYFRIALTNDEAAKLKNDMVYAKDVLSTIIGVIGNASLTNEERDAQIKQYIFDKAQASGPQEIQNLASFLQDGGKVSKAIYDYATYWYALTSTYSGRVVINESCDATCSDLGAKDDTCGIQGYHGDYCPDSGKCVNVSSCLRFKAKNFGNFIEANVRAGYIPIPDGCDMLSNDLISFLGWVLRIIRYGAIVITVVLGMTDFIGAITQDDDKAFKKAGGRFFKRVIAVIFIFISALFVQFVLVNYALPGIGENEINLCNITKYAAEADAD